MISPILVRTAIVAKLKADSTLTSWLAARSSAEEIREVDTQVQEFLYPALRYSVGPQIPQGTGPCYPFNSDCSLQLFALSELYSSNECEELAWLAHQVFFDSNIHAATFSTTRFLSNGLQTPARLPNGTWRIQNIYNFMILPLTSEAYA